MRRLLLFLGILLLAPAALAQTGRLGYYRYPDLHGDTVVFAAEGDIWKVSVSGGVAQRLTTHAAEESHPVISPDGTTVAFTARYEGPAEIYTMPIAGGLPVRRTYEPETSIATGWTADGNILYTTTHFSTLPNPQMVELDLSTGVQTRLPLAEASEGTYDATGSHFFFVRPAFHNNVTRRYTGGTARNIWRFSDGADEAVELTPDYVGESHSPMWWNGRVYFVTDPDGTMNLWSMDESGGDRRQHTVHAGWDVKEPSLWEGRIVYQVAADLWLYDIAADTYQKIPITLASDFDQLRERWVDDPTEYLTSAHIHPKGESVVFTARGRVFVAPAGSGRLVQASRKEGVRYRDVVFMPDGESLLGLSDESQELEFVKIPANGVGEPTALTDNGAILRFEGLPSPDGKWVAFTDNNSDLTLLDVETGSQQVISSTREGVDTGAWSPDSRWLAFEQTALNTYSQIWLYNVETGSRTAVTSDRVNSFDPAWDPSGDWLYFLSDRNLRTVVGGPWGPRQPEPYFDRTVEVYEVALRAGLRSRFRPADELQELAAAHEEGSGDDDGATTDGEVAIDLDGIRRRLRELPVPAGNYGGLAVNEHALFFSSRGATFGAPGSVQALPIGNDDPEVETVVEGARGFEMSADGNKLLVRRGEDFHVIDARPRRVSDLADSKVDLSAWAFPINVAEDWRQIFVDAWRLERDYFYDPDMHGVAWDVTLEKYLQLVSRVTTREELSDLIGRVVGELSALHTSVRGGDIRQGEDDINVASLGARLLRDPGAGGYRIDYVYQADPDYPDTWSPLADPELGVFAGDVIEAINGVDTLSTPHLGSLLRNQQGRQVLMRLRSASSGEVRDVIVVPMTNESNLRYTDWEVTRRLATEEKGEGEIGYVHLRAMGSGDLNAWYQQFYPVFDRQGLILDMRRNRGGNIDSIILEKLIRQAWFYWKYRVGRPAWNMQYAFRGHMVVLVDAETASDGEAFAEGFRRLELGPVIGRRTWGGEIWLSGVNTLSDGGIARAPMNGVYSAEGEWLIEQHGVVPDIEIDNLPHATFNGQDAQLDAAIAYLKQKIEEDPRPIPEAPPYPDKSFRYPVDRVTSGPGSGSQQR